MKFSVILTCAKPSEFSHTETLARATRLADVAERAGYEGIWLLEHHFTPYGLCPSPLTMASYLLGRTRTLRVGTAVCVLPLYHPLRFAEDVALIDQLSGGRLDVGIGRGGGERDFAAFGADAKKSHVITKEWLEIITTAWRGEPFDWHSELIELPTVAVNPHPLTERPPLYYACQSPSSVELAARFGMGMMLSYWLERETLQSQIELYDEIRVSAGVPAPPGGHVAACIAFPADTHQQAVDAVRPHLTWWRQEAQNVFFKLDTLRKMGNYDHQVRQWESEIIRGRAAADGTMEQSSVDRLLSLNPVGTVNECVDKLGALAESTGVEHFLCGFEGPAEESRVVEAMWRFAEEVVPALSPSAERGPVPVSQQ